MFTIELYFKFINHKIQFYLVLLETFKDDEKISLFWICEIKVSVLSFGQNFNWIKIKFVLKFIFLFFLSTFIHFVEDLKNFTRLKVIGFGCQTWSNLTFCRPQIIRTRDTLLLITDNNIKVYVTYSYFRNAFLLTVFLSWSRT